ncbi:MAG: FAD-dependent oxidoreductase, partial [Bilophila sp.]
MDLLVVGAGPAGLAAACAARDCGLDVTLVDEQATPGGQLFRNIESPLAQAL